jgi:16S rRNA (cytosine1402-N4)-methyltransferase
METQVPDPSIPHHPVLYQEILTALAPFSPGKYVDGTLGAGGHAFGLLQGSSPAGELLGIDLDPVALDLASRHLKEFGSRVHLIHGSYSDLSQHLNQVGWQHIDGVVLDLGVSSMQLDRPEKGFSFRQDAPLDMRFNPSAPQTGAELLNGLDEAEINRILWEYGEEQQARRITRAIIQNRPIQTTGQLANIIEKAIGRRGAIHPATRTFQALRIAVNGELDNLREVLPQIVEALGIGGRAAIISFHSLEDRIVKHFFQTESKDCICPPEQPTCTCNHRATLRLLTRHPLEASEQEKKENPRARSAKLRITERI